MLRRMGERWLVFTYGTLKRGEPNHHVLSDASNGFAEFVGEARLRSEYPLVIASRYNVPFLLDQPGLGQKVTGEMFSVDAKMLEALDKLEAHPTFYIRREEPVSDLHDPSKVMTPWVYFLPKFKPEMLEKKPYLETYSDKGSHGKPYVTRSQRNSDITASSEVLP